MPKKLPFKIEKSILCEDVREEISKKHTLVGVYAGDILISAIPGSMSLALYIEASVAKIGKFDLNLKLSGPGEHEATLKARIDVAQPGTAVIATPRIDLLVDQEGVFRLDLGTEGSDWVNVISKKIILNPSIATSAQQLSEQSPTASPESSSPPEPSPPSSPKKRRRI